MFDTLAELTRASFEPHLHTTFVVHTESQPIEIELVEVKSLGVATPPRREPFSLVFRGPVERSFAQGTYELQHALLGVHAIFIVPLGPMPGGMRYQVIFA